MVQELGDSQVHELDWVLHVIEQAYRHQQDDDGEHDYEMPSFRLSCMLEPVSVEETDQCNRPHL